MRKVCNMLFVLLKRIKTYMISCLFIYLIILPGLCAFFLKSGRSMADCEESMFLLFQVGGSLLAALGLALFLAPAVEEESRELLFIFERWFVKEALLFHIIFCAIAWCSAKICSIYLKDFSAHFFSLWVIYFLMQGFAFAILLFTNSAVFVIGSSLLYILYSLTVGNALFGFIFYVEMPQTQFWQQVFYCVGLGVCFWILGILRSLSPKW